MGWGVCGSGGGGGGGGVDRGGGERFELGPRKRPRGTFCPHSRVLIRQTFPQCSESATVGCFGVAQRRLSRVSSTRRVLIKA